MVFSSQLFLFYFLPLTLVYTPMRSAHRFQMLSQHEVTACVTPLEHERRSVHPYPDEHGVSAPTTAHIVVAGADNEGPLQDPCARCALHETRSIAFTSAGNGNSDDLGETVDHITHKTLDRNEHWTAFKGLLDLVVVGSHVRLSVEDIVLMRNGAKRHVQLIGERGRATVVRKRNDDHGELVGTSSVCQAEVERYYQERE